MTAWESFTNQKQWEAYLKNLVKTNDTACLRAILLIYDNQTEEEKNTGESIEDNCIGFTKIDAYEMGKIARKIKSGQPLTKGELAKSRNKMQKYWKQLMVISKRNMERAKQEQENLASMKMTEEEVESYLEEMTRRCLEEGKPCGYGICDECPNTLGNVIRSENNE